jgi:GNAT superfamily N-acetyltransferase
MSLVTTTYLEMRSPDQLNPRTDANGLVAVEAEIKQFRFNRFLYELVGATWQWVDKLSWSDDQWRRFAEADNLRTWLALYRGSPAGYYELQRQDDGNVEIAYFGLAPGFIGKGFGGYLLSHAITSAWNWQGTRRVWVHTCTLDHPGALNNYRSRGMTVYRTETADQTS